MKNLLLPLLLLLRFYHVQNSPLNHVLSIALCMARCPNELCVQTCNTTTKNIQIPYLEKKSVSNTSLQCKDVNRLALKHNPGIYVIEQKNENDREWRFPIISRENVYQFLNLSSARRYRFRIREVTSKGLALPEVTHWFQTHAAKYIPQKVRNISIDQFEMSRNEPGRMQAQLHIDPADDLNCLYDIVQWGQEHHLYQYKLDASQGYSFKLKYLEYNSNNTVHVMSRNDVDSLHSENATLIFTTPSCLDIYNNLTICPPPPVSGLKISTVKSGKNFVDFNIIWDEPKLHPNNYTILVQSIDKENYSVEITVPGNEYMVNISQVAASNQYKIGVIAESDGGSSFQWKTFTYQVDRSIGSEVIIAVSTLLSVTIFFTAIYVYYNYKTIKKNTCKYSVFENINKKNCVFDDVLSPLKSSSLYESEDNKIKDPFEIPIDRLTIHKVLGSGISGVVKLATLHDYKKRTINVAVKMLREDASENDIKNFQQEILLMKSTGNHRNIVSLIGCSTLNKNPLLIVEYCSKGDLLTYLRTILQKTVSDIFKRVNVPTATKVSSFLEQNNNAINNYLYDIQQAMNENTLTAEDLLSIARQVATGMEFLSSNRIVHRDLAARNVLVCADGTVKISDFGLSRDIYQENVYKKQSNDRLPLKWMAIEALTHQIYTTFSDVWSFGILLYEIVTLGGNPYPEWHSSEILHLLKSGYRMGRPSNCGFELYEIMRSCWHENPMNRPTFNQIKQQLDKLLLNSTKNEYLNLSELLREPANYYHLINKDINDF